ncbi:hypothetical protein XENTR_v10011396 [Xenopus tropicalis]|nr:hypothetical protein XENTR_v10011396 [Xenopus tropicalis]
MVELTGIIDSDILKKCDKKCKILGINTEKPFLQVDKYVFAGEYEDALGTCVIFEEDPNHIDEDHKKPQLKYKCHTVKKLNMTRTFLTEKKEGDAGGKIEWFHIKDVGSSSLPTTMCSFAQENEDGGDSQSDEEQELDRSNEDSGQLEQSFGMEKQDTEMKEECENGNLGLDKEERQGFKWKGKQVSEKKESQNSELKEKLESDKQERENSASEGKLQFNEHERQDSESEGKLEAYEQERQASESKLDSNKDES